MSGEAGNEGPGSLPLRASVPRRLYKNKETPSEALGVGPGGTLGERAALQAAKVLSLCHLERHPRELRD